MRQKSAGSWASTFWIFSPSALRMWLRAVSSRAMLSSRSVTAWAMVIGLQGIAITGIDI